MSDSTTPMKKCKICNQEFPLTTEYFHQTHGGKYWNSYCRTCANAKSLAYRHANLEARREHGRKRYQENRDTIVERKRQYRVNNPEQHAKAQNKWKSANRKHLTKYMNQWRAENPEQSRLIFQRYKARKRSLPDTFTLEQWLQCLEYFENKCATCGVSLDDTTPHQDHWIPITSDDCPGTVAENMICLCAHCNQSKWALEHKVWLERTFGALKAEEIIARIEAYFEWVKLLVP